MEEKKKKKEETGAEQFESSPHLFPLMFFFKYMVKSPWLLFHPGTENLLKPLNFPQVLSPTTSLLFGMTSVVGS